MAMLLAAPGLLSISTGCPTLSETFWPTVRATMSIAPPGAKPTRMRMGFEGNDCAAAVAAEPRAMARNNVCKAARAPDAILIPYAP
jgi:hypothetical protein